MKYKALITDLDGTLFPQSVKKGLPTKKVQLFLERARKKVHIGIATGRSLLHANHLISHLKLSGPSILQGGALIINSTTKEILFKKTLPIDTYSHIVSIFKKHRVEYIVDEPHQQGITVSDSYVPKDVLTIFGSEMSERKTNEVLHDLSMVKDIHITKVPSWTTTLWGLNVNHAEASKQHAILEISKILNIKTSEIIGIGDGYNDLPLLMACGLKVAMGNAVDELKAIADYIAPSIEEDGLADVIEKFVLNPA